jgi:hypothetical protein
MEMANEVKCPHCGKIIHPDDLAPTPEQPERVALDRESLITALSEVHRNFAEPFNRMAGVEQEIRSETLSVLQAIVDVISQQPTKP